MSKFTKDEIENIEISGIRKFNQKTNNISNVIKLTLGELDFEVDPAIKKAIKKALDNNQTNYTTNAGLKSLRSKITHDYDNYDETECIITVGSTEGISTTIRSVVSPGDEVIIPTPGYVGYKPLITLEGGIVKEINLLKTNNTLTMKQLMDVYSNKTKALIITNPNNPTGKVYSEKEMEIIKEFVLKYNVLLIVDEIYSDIVFSDYYTSFASYTSLKHQLIILNGFSKSHAMTGLRIGYLLSAKELVSQLLKTHQYSVTSATSISQYGALKALDVDNNIMVETLKKRRDFLISRLTELKLPFISPDGAFYIFVDISKFGLTSEEFCDKLLMHQQVAVIPGKAFLGKNDHYIRLSYATNLKTLKEAMEKFSTFIRNI
ncbi:MAG: aminotransferase class I/II-fold pyridoxal phosphate-dependent enzyme [Candidatus Izimaplasma sp.]|nr:aminotransferase class I/II-fold pyridoxal phosphate-dependent enzyme [Candidatus Izimaplasma bacterium]